MKKIFSYLLLLQIIGTSLLGCKQSGATKEYDTPQKGTIYISVDESFRPVIEQQIQVYELSYPGTHIIASYKTEAECFKDFFKDSLNRMIIVGRSLYENEERYLIDSLHFNPGCNAVASDAIAVIINSKSLDSLFTLEDLRSGLLGKNDIRQTFVFDGLKTTSTMRFIQDSVLKGQSFNSNVVKTTSNSQELINYVSSHENAIGFVGISWLGNPEDSVQRKYLDSVKIAYIKCEVCKDNPFVKPVQESMITRRYPLVRGLFYINKENYLGLGSGFVAFLKYERGQLIFKRSYLGPVMDFEIRRVQINQTSKN
jgi:phosphate transport system substrate-binding protein